MRNISKKMVIEVSQNGAEKTAAALGTLDKAQARVAVFGGQANLVLLNTTRVVQDMPYGLIAVSNNVDMLVQQFIALRATSGSTTAALAAIKATMLGPAGLLFLFSAATAAAVLWTRSQSDVAKESDKVQKALDKEREVLDKYLSAVDRLNDRGKGGTASGRAAATDEERRLAQARLKATEDYIAAMTSGEAIIVDNIGKSRAEVTAYEDQLARLQGKSIETAKTIAEEWRNAVQAARGAVNEVRVIADQTDLDPFSGVIGVDPFSIERKRKNESILRERLDQANKRRNERLDYARNMRNEGAVPEGEDEKLQRVEEAQRNLFSGFNQMNSSLQTLGVTSDSVFGKMLNYLNQIYAVIQLINSVKTIASAVTTLFSGLPGGAAGGVGNLEAVLAVPENRRALAYTVRDMSRKGML